MNEKQIEKFALHAARGDSVEKWPRGFNEDQKKFWRQFVVDLAAAIGDSKYQQGYKVAQMEHAEHEKARIRRAQRHMTQR